MYFSLDSNFKQQMKDKPFSVDDFESVKTSPWEGVRNYEARNLMKEMKVGEKARHPRGSGLSN